MIIVSITDPEDQAVSTIRKSAAADMIELRLDNIGHCDVGRLIGSTDKPVIVTCRRLDDGGDFTGAEEKRFELLRKAAAEGAAYVDIEVDAADKLGKLPEGVKRIVSYHDTTATPPTVKDIYSRIVACKPDVAKLVTTAMRPVDMVHVLELLENPPVPTIAFTMGDIGTASRVIGKKLGAFATYAAPDEDRAAAPGQIPLSDLINVYRYRDIGPKTAIYGLIGDPVEHSLGPVFHNRAFKIAGVDAVYLPFRIINNPAEFLSDFRKMNIHGFSVTHPHKGAFRSVVGRIEGGGGELSHLNTLSLEGGSWRGHNTDAPAISEILDEFIPDPMLGFTAVVLGAGGAARAACMVLRDFGANVIVAARNKDKGKRFALDMNVDFVPMREVGKIDWLLMINATPVGMEPHVLESPVSKNDFKPGRYVWDFIYSPRKSRLLREAEAAHCVTLSGLSVFVAQARHQQKIWTGKVPPDIALQ
ncbi:MAG: type I 3-dehydroquinate dehydratase [Planctomycetota bacterium]